MSNVKNPYLDGTGLSQVWAAIIANFVKQAEGMGLSANDFSDALKAKLEGIAEGANVNVIETVKVNGVALSITDKGVDILVPDAYTKTETDAAIATALSSAYKVKGSIVFASLPTESMSVGDVYNITDAFTTTDAFKEGAGAEYPAGTNVVYTEDGWDCLAGIYDFSGYLTADDIRSMTDEEIAAICTIE